MIIVNLSNVCQELQQIIVSLLQKAIKKEGAEEGRDGSDGGAGTTIENRSDKGQIIILSTEGEDRLKIKLLIEKALYEDKKIGKNFDDYLVAENDEDPNEIAILKKGDIQQLGLFICGFCSMVFRSEIEKNIHQRVHYFGFG